MTLARDQQRGLDKLKENFKRLEQYAFTEGFDLDIFMSEFLFYGKAGFSMETSQSNALQRKLIFENQGKEKTKSETKEL